ncbi:MAG: pilus assembly protein TadG-related protein [Nocardioidaceae bacterium]
MTAFTSTLRRAVRERARRTADQAGYAAILMALLVAGILFPIASFAVDVARWYVEGERVQAAADAAAMAGVTYLPEYFSQAQTEAIKVAGKNGYPNSGTSTVTVALGSKPTQLRVTVTSRVHNSIAASWGDDYTTIKRTAVADYNGPAPMGSPCNTFGNEPPGTAGAGPAGSVLSVPDSDAQCSTTPMFWTAIAGPDTPKANGDQIMTRTCASGNDGCSGTTNTDFNPKGYFYVVRATPAAVGRTVTLQLYDAAWAEVGDACDQSPSGTVNNNNWNDYATTDAIARYAKTAGNYCPGDVLNGSGRITTTFGLRNPTVTQYPPNGTPITGCAKQFPGYVKAEVTSAALQKGNASYNAGLARTFRQWTNLCSFTVTQAGDYYLQVRTNVSPVSTTPTGGKYTGLDTYGGWTGSNADKVYSQAGDDTTVGGQGNNRFAIRISGAPAGSMSVAGWQTMSIYMNYTGATAQFNLVRVIPAAATKYLMLTFFDVGDASQPGTIKILPPTDSNLPSNIAGCVGAGVVTGALSNCTLTNVSSSAGYNGRSQTIKIPIPAGYTCHVSNVGGCWFRVQFSFPATGVPNDTTTWTALVSGDPVRLIE